MKNSDTITASSMRNFFRMDVILFQLVGLSTFEFVFSGEKFEARWWNGFFSYIIILMIFPFIICQLNSLFFMNLGLDASIETILLLTVFVAAIIKGARWWTHRLQVYNILQELSTEWDIAQSQKFLSIENIKVAENARYLRSIYIISIGFNFAVYILQPYMKYLSYRLQGNTNDSFSYNTATVFPIAYPFAIDSFQKLCAIVSYEQFTDFFICVYYASSDSFFIQLTSHISIHFMILAKRLENIVTDDENSNYDDYIRQQLRGIAKQHHQLLRCCESSENIYDPIIFVVLVSNGINICTRLYAIDDQLTSLDWSQASRSLSGIVVLYIETIMYCDYADRLTQSSANVYHAAYRSQWMNWSQRNKRTLFIIMMRAAKEYQLTAYHMIPVNLKQLTAITNAAVSYFMLLKSFK